MPQIQPYPPVCPKCKESMKLMLTKEAEGGRKFQCVDCGEPDPMQDAEINRWLNLIRANTSVGWFASLCYNPLRLPSVDLNSEPRGCLEDGLGFTSSLFYNRFQIHRFRQPD
jgi:Zn ribbon nucleic-acid-binding protein